VTTNGQRGVLYLKIKKFLLPSIFFVVTIIAYIIASVVFCYTTKPEIESGDFPFSITYEYKGEKGTLTGVYHCKFLGSSTYLGMHERWWDGEAIYNTVGKFEYPFIIDRSDEMSLSLHEHMNAGYFMGDPLHNYYEEYYDGKIAPYAEYYDYVNDISLNDENSEEILEYIDFKILEYTYAEPIENSFSFSGIQYEADNISIFVLVSLLFFVLCLIFVRKDKEYKYSFIDKLGIGFNFAVGIFAIPFITLFCYLHGIFGRDNIISQIVYNIPPFSIICLALSVVFRRKEFKKTGLVIQFAGTALFAIYMVLEAVFGL
jgi:hypothetical protein